MSMGSRPDGEDEFGPLVELQTVVEKMAEHAQQALTGDAVAQAAGRFDMMLSTWMSREGHLAVRRAHEMMAEGVPAETALFLAIDDPGFQFALNTAQAWEAM